jgi:hypothetical protein
VLVDACVPFAVVDHLSRAGFDTKRPPRSGQPNAPDDAQVLALAVAEQRVVVTTDFRKDFQRLHARYQQSGRTHYGIVLAHPRWGPSMLCKAFETTLLYTPEHALHNNLIWATPVTAGP